MAGALDELEAVEPATDADFGIRGKEDYDAFFRYLHDLLVREGTTTEYGVICTSLQLGGSADAKTPAATTAEKFRRGLILDELAFPDLRDPRHRASQGGSTGLRLSSPDLAWLKDEHARWLAAGGPKELVTFTSHREVEPLRSFYPALLRALHWLQRVVGPASDARLEVDFEGPSPGLLKVGIAGSARDCRDCKLRHEGNPCVAVLRAARPSHLKNVWIKSERASARFSVADGPDGPSLWLRVRDADAATLQGEWPKLLATPWDLDPAKVAALPAPAPIDVRAIDVTPRTPGAPREERFVAARKIQAYAEPTYFLLWKAAHWLSQEAGTAKAITAVLEGPDERIEVELAGDRARCELCGSEHPPLVCEKLVLLVPPERLVALRVEPATDRALEVRPPALEVRSEASRRDLATAPLEAWTKIERAPWDVP